MCRAKGTKLAAIKLPKAALGLITLIPFGPQGSYILVFRPKTGGTPKAMECGIPKFMGLYFCRVIKSNRTCDSWKSGAWLTNIINVNT